jgi:hypothetical protein
VNLDPRAGPAWKLYDREDSLTLFPSVWRESGCEAHFILWRNRLIRCDVLAKRRAQEARSQAAAGARTAEVEQVL